MARKMATKINSLIVLVIYVLLFSNFGNNVYAQTYSESPFNIKIFVSEQDPETKIFRIKTQIDSKIASDRNTIKWVLPDGLQTKMGDTELIGYYCRINEGQNDLCNKVSTPVPNENIIDTKTDEFDFILDVIPKKKIDGNIIFSIQSYINDGEKSYRVTQVAKIEVNSDLELQPKTSNYNESEQIINYRQLSTQLMLLVFVLFSGLIVFRRIYIYIKPPIKSTIPNNSKILDAYQKLGKGKSLQEKQPS